MQIFHSVVGSAFGVMVLAAGTALAQDYPSRPIGVVTTAAGGGNDIQTRFMTPVMSASLGVPIVVDNRAGSGLANENVAKSPADGYTILYAGQTTWLTPLLQKTPYEMQDFTGISQVAREIYVLTVHPSLPVKSVKELVALSSAVSSTPAELATTIKSDLAMLSKSIKDAKIQTV